MVDRSTQLIVTALRRAAAGEAPLHKTKKQDGLFPATAAGKQAARRCQDDGLLAARAHGPSSANGSPHWALTEKGFTYLFSQVSPQAVLEELVRALDDRDEQLVELLTLAGQMRMQLAALRAGADQVLQQFTDAAGCNGVGSMKALYQAFLHGARPSPHGEEPCEAALLRQLARWRANNNLDDLPLPELYRKVAAETGEPSIGRFHDTLRRLHEKGRVHLHPWTGPLYEMPEPAFALLVGHEVAYYASSRD